MNCRIAPRASTLAALFAFSTAPIHASTPPEQDVTVPNVDGQVVVIEWTGTAPAGVFGGANTCTGSSVGEDGHIINLTVPAGTYDDFLVKADFHVEWDNDNDYVLTVLQGTTVVGDSDGGTPEENVSANDPVAGEYSAIICPFLSTAATPYRGKLTLTATAKGGSSPDLDADGVLNESDVCPGTPAGSAVDAQGCTLSTASGLAPRFQIHVAPAGLGDDAGEPSVGYNKFTNRTMFISYTHALRQTYQEEVVPPLLPASCPATWEEKSGLLTTIQSLDPILFTDEATGRTFNSQLTGANSAFEFTDDDGETWTPGQIAASNGGADHQTVASGPFPAAATPLTASWPATGPKRAVYYCSQSVAAAFCSRSDDGGVTFGPGMVFKNLDCLAGGLHGHVKVAPDGTVYVPDSSQCVLPIGGTAGNVITHVSNDAGVTWTVRTIPTSTGGAGSDPSIGIATDGTLYMCYENADSSVRMAVSKDKGVTWINDKNIGAPLGIVQSRFPHAIAGDGGRAACAFLGTTTPGNGSSLAFTGVWHGYIATTYNEGVDYHVVNVTPNDPVQGFGGVGPDGTNRNLLDFNDLQVDEFGRLLFAFADGCTGPCVTDPSANAFEAKATIVRQSGGRTMYAAFDNTGRYNTVTPLAPAPACARKDLSSRNLLGADVVWNAPDTGGQTIANYRVYRAEAEAGPYVLLGDAGPALSFHDGTTRPSVEKYYYKVDAQNPAGTSLFSNIIDLPISVGGSTCELPGILTVTDPDGDVQSMSPSLDIQAVYLAEPEEHAGKIVATLKIATLDPAATPSMIYAVRFESSTAPANGDAGYFIALSTAEGGERFVHGTYRVEETPAATLTVYTIGGDIDPASSYDADGSITLIADKALFGLDTGDTMSGIIARTGPATSNSTPITAGAQDDTGTGFYVLVGSEVCADPGLPLAELRANVNEGAAPLDVLFTLSGAQTKGKGIVSYSLIYGDGSPAQTGSFGGAGFVQLTHRYAAGGVYRARLTVTDEVGTVSTNLAEETITVIGAEILGVSNGNNRLGGALNPLALLGLAGLGLLGWMRRRR